MGDFSEPQPVPVDISNGQVSVDAPEPPPYSDLGAGTEEPFDKEQPKTRRREPGQGKKRGSGIPQLTAKDINALYGMYGQIAMVVSVFKPNSGQTIAENAESCVDSWVTLAEQNDSVRKAIHAMLETGAWSGVVAAHFPILMSLVPQNALDRMPGLFGQNEPQQDDEQDSQGEGNFW